MSLAQKYRKSLEQRLCLQFETSLPGGDRYAEIVTHNRPRFVALASLVDFAFDGVVILPKKFIRSCRDGDNERCTNEIISSNGALNGLRPLGYLDGVETILGLFVELQRRDIWPGVEMLTSQGKKTAFYIGPVLEVRNRSFDLNCYDAAGHWEKEYELPLGKICSVSLGDRYTTEFNRYMRAKSAATVAGQVGRVARAAEPPVPAEV